MIILQRYSFMQKRVVLDTKSKPVIYQNIQRIGVRRVPAEELDVGWLVHLAKNISRDRFRPLKLLEAKTQGTHLAN